MGKVRKLIAQGYYHTHTHTPHMHVYKHMHTIFWVVHFKNIFIPEDPGFTKKKVLTKVFKYQIKDKQINRKVCK